MGCYASKEIEANFTYLRKKAYVHEKQLETVLESLKNVEPPTSSLNPLFATHTEAIPAQPADSSVAVQSTDAGRNDEVLFFPVPDGKLPCRHYFSPAGCNRPAADCMFAHAPSSLNRFLDLLGSCTQTCDVCVYTITCKEISDVLLALHRRGVLVRIITDNNKINALGSDIDKLWRGGATGPGERVDGIDVRRDAASILMHHKFCILDSRTVLNGSFNWTRQAVTTNRENVMVCHSPTMVVQFVDHFNDLWKRYAPSAKAGGVQPTQPQTPPLHRQ